MPRQPKARKKTPSRWRTGALIRGSTVLAQLPWPVLVFMGDVAGRLAWRLARRRRHIAEVNVALCFPELPAQERRQLAYQSVHGAGMALVEAMASYFKADLDLSDRLEILGMEYVEKARESGRGILLLGMHFDTIDISAHLMGLALDRDVNAVYRPHDNPALENVIRKGRGRHLDKSFDRADIRGIVRALRNGEMVWYAPDQDYGRKHSVFAPFFGIEAATITATTRIANMGNAVVLPVAQSRQAGGRYRLEFGPPLDNFPSGDKVADATRVNAVIEEYVRKEPGQYLWVHRRFKHRPPGEPGVY